MDRRVMALASLGLAGSVGVILFLALAGDQPVFWFSVFLLGILAVICETLGERMASGGRSTYGIIALFAAIAALNTPSAMIVALVSAFHMRLLKRKDSPWEMAGSAAIYAVCTWAAAAVYHALGGASRAFTTSMIRPSRGSFGSTAIPAACSRARRFDCPAWFDIGMTRSLPTTAGSMCS